MNERDRRRFDAMLEDVLREIPVEIRNLLDESPLIIEDAPDADLVEELGLKSDDVLCGLYTGLAMTERSVSDDATLPDQIQIFREGIVHSAGGWGECREAGDDAAALKRVRDEIRITVLHEIGHHFGLSEEDLDSLGYG